jgi:hypothetical protein
LQTDANHPSQAEGEDPESAPGGSVQPEDGHPSQAEGEDPDASDISKSGTAEQAAGNADSSDEVD